MILLMNGACSGYLDLSFPEFPNRFQLPLLHRTPEDENYTFAPQRRGNVPCPDLCPPPPMRSTTPIPTSRPTTPETGGAWDPSAKDPDGPYHLPWIEDTKLSTFASSLKFQVEADGVPLTVTVSERSGRVVVYKGKMKLNPASLSPVHPTRRHKGLWCIIKGHFKGCLCQSIKFEIVANDRDTQMTMWLVRLVELNIDGSFVLMDTCIEVPSSNLIVMDIIDRRQKELYQQDIVQKVRVYNNEYYQHCREIVQ